MVMNSRDIQLGVSKWCLSSKPWNSPEFSSERIKRHFVGRKGAIGLIEERTVDYKEFRSFYLFSIDIVLPVQRCDKTDRFLYQVRWTLTSRPVDF